jgi:DNA-binding NarL/FixJ family response regulator
MDIVIADGMPEVRSAIRLLLSEVTGARIAAEAADVSSLLDVTRAVRPALVLVDWDLADVRPEGARGVSLPTEITQACPQARVVVMSGRPEKRRDALAAGADAFVCKCDAPDRLLATLRGI